MSRFKSRRFEVIVVAGLMVGLWFVLLASYQHAREIKRGTSCQSNLKLIGLAMAQYTRDYDEVFPIVDRWSESLFPYCKTDAIFHCPALVNFGYSMNTFLDCRNLDQMEEPAKTPLAFDSSIVKRFQHDDGASWLAEERHPQGNAVVFVDGHVAWMLKPPAFRYFPIPEPRMKFLPGF